MNKESEKNEKEMKNKKNDENVETKKNFKDNKNKSFELKDKIIADLKVKLKDSEDRVLRELAENENLRKRHDKEQQENLKYAIKNFSYEFLNVTDNFSRALESISSEEIEKNLNLKNLFFGLQAVEKEIYDIFEKNGIKKFESMKKQFDPEVHQAVSKKDSELPEGQVIEELQKGFMIGDRLLRPAMVVISSGKPSNKKD